MPNAVYDKGREAFLAGDIDWAVDTIKVALVSSSYTPNTSTDQFWSTASSAVIGTPQTLASKTLTAGVADAADVIFTAVSSGTVSKLVIYKDTGTDSTSPLICVIDTASGLPVTANGGDITIAFDGGSNRIFKL